MEIRDAKGHPQAPQLLPGRQIQEAEGEGRGQRVA